MTACAHIRAVINCSFVWTIKAKLNTGALLKPNRILVKRLYCVMQIVSRPLLLFHHTCVLFSGDHMLSQSLPCDRLPKIYSRDEKLFQRRSGVSVSSSDTYMFEKLCVPLKLFPMKKREASSGHRLHRVGCSCLCVLKTLC